MALLCPYSPPQHCWNKRGPWPLAVPWAHCRILFPNTTFSGTPVVSRVDREVNFNWDKFPPVAGVERNNYSVRWIGTFAPPAPGDYKLGVRMNYCYACENAEGFKLYLDDKLILQSAGKTPERGAVMEVPEHFADTAPHRIRLEYVHGTTRQRGDRRSPGRHPLLSSVMRLC